VWRRGLARATDLATVLFVQWALTVLHVFWFVGPLSERVAPAPWGEAFVPTVLFVVLSGIYEVVFLRWNRGRTPGKDAWHVKVVTAGTGEAPGLTRSLARWTGPGLTLLVWPLWLAGGLLVVWGAPAAVTTRRQAFHDMLWATMVVVDERDDDDDAEDEA
jgi:uncharacterized RDD family membrane protein YckC